MHFHTEQNRIQGSGVDVPWTRVRTVNRAAFYNIQKYSSWQINEKTSPNRVPIASPIASVLRLRRRMYANRAHGVIVTTKGVKYPKR